MARWLLDAAARLPRTGSYLMGIGGLVMSLCGAVLILSMCSLCHTRWQVRDKLSSSDSDFSPAKPAAPTKKISAKNGVSSAAQGKDKLNSSAEPHPPKSPHVWQRTILMGERCQRPTFSGLILYDEKGNPLPRSLPVLQGQAKG